jgi:gliding motility-associated lipoprotein GldH
MPNRIRYWIIVAALLPMASCRNLEVYEKNVPMPGSVWSGNFVPVYQFEIKDTTARYNIYAVLRHTAAYRYNNIWLNAGTAFPGDSMRYQRVELRLGNDAAGWEGSGMDDIWEVRKPLTPGPVKLGKKGLYTFSLAQIMREEKLPAIMSAGIRVEKARP